MLRRAPGMVGEVSLEPDDIIDDRELATVEEDQLAHDGIANQLAALVTNVNTPANIALYGPWGSGKSGIANLLQSKIDHENGMRFVRFDAFKYADVPLRRNFISGLAKELGCNHGKYHSELYSGRTKTDISVPPMTVIKLLFVFSVLVASLTAILVGVVAVVAVFQQGEFWASFRSLSKQAILAGLLPASLLASLITLASKTFSVDRSLAKPESDEQFEQLFRELVEDTRASRLVVFIDELDRCSAAEVVTTLDTVRTFLGIKECVFIIAADQNVLEEALTRAASQETPSSEANPYYSTGNAYLDKVFQYQVSLPPLLTQSVGKYANRLVSGRGGVWAEINTEYVLSVLVPTHVASPRRVKHLLNTFALTYRLAEERHRAGLLTEDPRDSAAAIARLVCLRVEFPLFARHLEIDANLPNLILQLIRDKTTEFSFGVSERVRNLARAYALHGAAPATFLAPDEEEGAEAEIEGVKSSVAALNKQLLNYLGRTRQIRGPSRHLIHMQSSGTAFGLEGAVALAVEKAAEDGDIATLQSQVTGLSEAQREGALELLSQQIRTGSGVVAPNTARSFLLLNKVIPDLHVQHVVDAVAEAICVLDDDDEGVLDEDTVASAWALAKAGSESGAKALRSRVVAATIAPEMNESAGFLIDDAMVALETSPDQMTTFLTSLLVSEDGGNTISCLFTAPDDDIVRILKALHESVAERANASAKAHAAWSETQEEAAAAKATRATTGAQASTPELEDEPYDPKVLFSSLAEEARTRETPVQHETLRLLLAVDDPEARSAAENLIRRSEPTKEPELATAILGAARRRKPASWRTWLEGISQEAILPRHAELLERLVATLWSQQLQASVPEAALQEIALLVDALPEEDQPNLTSKILEQVEPLVTDANEASARRLLLARAERFSATGFVDSALIADAVVSTLQETLAQELSPVDRDDAMYQYVSLDGADALSACGSSVVEEKLNGIMSEASTSPWLGDLGLVELPLTLATAAGPPEAALDNLPDAQAVADIVHNYAGEATNAATLWVDLVKPYPGDLALVLEQLLFERVISNEFAEAAQRTQVAWTSTQRRDFLERYIAQPESDVPADLVLKAVGLTVAEKAEIADLLCDRFTRSTNNSQRQAVMDLWVKAEIHDTALRKRLIETVIYGLLSLHADGNRNAGAVEIALAGLDRVGYPLPHGVKGVLGQRLKAAIDGNNALEVKALRVLPRLGYSTSKALFSKARRVDYGEK